MRADWVRSFSAVNPVSYVADAARAMIVSGFEWPAFGRSVLAIAIFGVVLHGLALRALYAEGK